MRGAGQIFLQFVGPTALRIVTASADKIARVWDAVSARVVRGSDDSSVNFAAFSSDGSRIVLALDDRTARVWDVGSAKEVAVLRGHADSVRSAVFSHDRSGIVTASRD